MQLHVRTVSLHALVHVNTPQQELLFDCLLTNELRWPVQTAAQEKGVSQQAEAQILKEYVVRRHYICGQIVEQKHCSGIWFLAWEHSFKSSAAEVCCVASCLLPAPSPVVGQLKTPGKCSCFRVSVRYSNCRAKCWYWSKALLTLMWSTENSTHSLRIIGLCTVIQLHPFLDL